MARENDRRGGEKPVRKGGRGFSLGCLGTVLLAVLILGVAAAFAVRTRGFCELLANYLSDRAGAELTVKSAFIGLPCDLVIQGLATKAAATNEGWLRVDEVRVGCRLDGGLRVRARGAELRLVKTGSNDWQPSAFERIGTLKSVTEMADIFADYQRNLHLDLRGSAVYLMEGHRLMASAEGLSFRATPIDVPGRAMWCFELTAGTVRRANAGQGRNVRREWISVKENAYLEIDYRGKWEGGNAPEQDFWSMPAGLRTEVKSP